MTLLYAGVKETVKKLSDEFNEYETPRAVLNLCFTCLFPEVVVPTSERNLVKLYDLLYSTPQYCSHANRVVYFIAEELQGTMSQEDKLLKEQAQVQNEDSYDILTAKELKFTKLVMKLSYEDKRDLVDVHLLTPGGTECVPTMINVLVSTGELSYNNSECLRTLSASFSKNSTLARFASLIAEVHKAQSIMVKGKHLLLHILYTNSIWMHE